MPRRMSKSRRSGPGSSDITRQAGKQLLTSPTSFTRGGSVNPSVAKYARFQPGQEHVMADGGRAVIFPTFEPIYGGKPHVNIVEFNQINIPFVANGGVSPSGTPAILNEYNLVYAMMLDNIARAYANAQNLNLTALTDMTAFIKLFMQAASVYIALGSILNGDGWNERVSQMATIVGPLRARVQQGFDRLQSIPMPPGILDLLYRSFGLFAAYEGGHVWFSVFNSSGIVTPADYTTLAAYQTILSNAELALTTLTTAAEQGPIRIVFSEFYGAPEPISAPGVRICPGLYNQFRLMGVIFSGATNSTGFPYVTRATGVQDASMSILIPRGYEDQIWWSSYWRLQCFSVFGTVVKANATIVGMITQTGTLNTSIGYMVQGQTTQNNSQTTGVVANGFSDPLYELYFQPLVNGLATDLASDVRTQNDFSSYPISPDIMTDNTVNIIRRVFVGKEKFGYPSDTREYNVARIFGAKTNVLLT